MKILDLCGGTGAWSKPYTDAGYDVELITLPEHNVLNYIPPNKVYGVLAAPVCTCFARSGARWKRTDREMDDAWELVEACLYIIEKCNPVFWALENPIGKLVRYLGKPKLYFQPWEYGDSYTKKTCLWGNFNIPKKNIVNPGPKDWFHNQVGGKSERTKMIRSITPSGFAKAFFEANHSSM